VRPYLIKKNGALHISLKDLYFKDHFPVKKRGLKSQIFWGSGGEISKK
jgi:hypothetical protein